LTLPHFIEVPILSQESEQSVMYLCVGVISHVFVCWGYQSCICVLGLSVMYLCVGVISHVFVCWGYLSCICVLGLSIFPLSTILIFDFGIVPTVWYFLFFTLLLRIALYPMENVLKKFFLRRYKLDWKYAIMIIWMILCIIYTYCMSELENQVATTAGNNQKYSFSEIPQPFKTEFVCNVWSLTKHNLGFFICWLEIQYGHHYRT